MKRLFVIVAVIISFSGTLSNADAGLIELKLPEYSSPYHDPGTYNDKYLVGHFDFDLNGEKIVAAKIYGTWGNTEYPNTAHNKLFLDDLLIANTHDYTPDPYWDYYVPWAYTFTDFTVLEDGSADLFTVQTSEYHVRLDETTLLIETAPVPIPASIIIFGSGLLALAALAPKKASSKKTRA